MQGDDVDPAVGFEWGPVGAARASRPDGVLVVVDVLSFTTSVSVVVERGTAVYPSAWNDSRATSLADEVGAVLAVGRHEVSRRHPWSLSPAALRAAPAPDRLVLPSPNGSAIAAAIDGGLVVAACLRNAAAVGAWIRHRRGVRTEPVVVVAGGERWPDGSLRPALEDLLGAGAVLDALAGDPDVRLTPEAAATRAAFLGTSSVADAVRACSTADALLRSGFASDVDIAVELDSSEVVPLLADGAFRAADDLIRGG